MCAGSVVGSLWLTSCFCAHSRSSGVTTIALAHGFMLGSLREIKPRCHFPEYRCVRNWAAEDFLGPFREVLRAGPTLSIFIDLSVSSFWSSVRPRDPVEVFVGLLVAAGSLRGVLCSACACWFFNFTLSTLQSSANDHVRWCCWRMARMWQVWPGCFGVVFVCFAACAASADGKPQSHQEVGGAGEPGGVLKLAVGKGHWRLQVYS